MNTYINLNEKFIIDTKNRMIINKDTGEVFTEDEEVQSLLSTLKKDKAINRSVEKTIRDTWGIKTELDLYYKGWKNNSLFIKIYRTERREYLQKIKLSPNASKMLLYIEGYIEFKTNRLTSEEGGKLTNNVLKSITGLSDVSIKNALNELEKNLIIKRVGVSNSREIYINPYLMCAGDVVLKETIELFEDAGYQPITSF